MNTWPRNPTNNFTIKNCLFGTVKLVRNTIKCKFTYNVQVIVFDEVGSQSFCHDFARNVANFGFYNSLSSHTDNRKNNFLVLDDGPSQGTNDSTGAAEKKVVLTLVKEIQNVA